MFKCSECGLEYEIKPDFCDCGNDIFEELVPTKSESLKRQINLPKQDIISWIIFCICLVLSIIVLLFFPKIEEKSEQPSKPVLEKQTKPVPDFNSLWKDFEPQEEQGVIEQIKDVVFKPTSEPIKQAAKPQPQPKAQVQQKVQTQVKPKPAQVQTQQKPKQVTTPTVGKPQNRTSYNYEIVNYRTALRQRLFSNLDLYRIEGGGTCGVEFSIDENGKLLNRNFSFQSDNSSVNDEVYKMLMRTPKFNPPPAGYANKLIKIRLKLTSDSYEIDFLN